MSSETPDRLRSRQFASDVAKVMYEMRGYTVSSVPSEVRSDVFATMVRHDSIYSHGFTTNRPGRLVGRDIQTAEWEAQ